jgi:hypothetical protein
MWAQSSPLTLQLTLTAKWTDCSEHLSKFLVSGVPTIKVGAATLWLIAAYIPVYITIVWQNLLRLSSRQMMEATNSLETYRNVPAKFYCTSER